MNPMPFLRFIVCFPFALPFFLLGMVLPQGFAQDWLRDRAYRILGIGENE